MRLLFSLIVLFVPFSAGAQDRQVRLHAPPALTQTGLFDYILPRFSLKTQVRVTLVDSPAEAEVTLGAEGQPVFEGAGAVWHLDVLAETDWTRRFADWLTSETGERTVFAFAPDGAVLFQAPGKASVVVAAVEIGGDAVLGRNVSRRNCARCHAVDEATRKTTIGSTPSFFVLRGFPDWEARFGAFYTLNPHPAFTQIAEVTDPFPQDRPSPIVPIEMTVDEIEAVLAYVAALAAADLGEPLENQ